MTQLFTKSFWQKARKDNLQAARGCRKTLTDPQGHWRYAPDDTRVAKAVAYWVAKARENHGIVMERRPVCFVLTNAGSGNVYGGEAV